MTPPPEDFPLPTTGGGTMQFSDYALLILHELKRLNSGQESLQSTLNNLVTQAGLDRQAHDNLKHAFEDFKTDIESALADFKEDIAKRLDGKPDGLEPRVKVIESDREVNKAFIRGKWWVVAGAFVVVLPAILTLLNVVSIFKGL